MSTKELFALAARFEDKLQKQAALFDDDVTNFLYNINVYSQHCLSLLEKDPRKAKLIAESAPQLDKMYMFLERVKATLMQDIEEIN